MAEDRLVFDYRDSFTRRGLIILPVIALCCPFFIPVLGYWVSGLFFAIVGLVSAIIGLKFRTERIEIEGGYATWFDKLGRDKVKMPMSSIMNGTSTYAGSFKYFLFRSSDGKFLRFGIGLTNVGKLLSILGGGETGVAPEVGDWWTELDQECRYGRKRTGVIIGRVALGALFAALGFGFLSIQRRLISGGHYTWLEPSTFTGLIYALLSLEILVGAYSLWIRRKERVTVREGRIVMFDDSGREALNVGASDVVAGSMTWSIKWSYGAQSIFCYEVRTGHGVLHWTGDMENADQLCRYMRFLCGQPLMPIPVNMNALILNGWPMNRIAEV